MSNPIPLVLDDAIREAIATAFQSGHFVTVGYTDADGWARISNRGTVQVLDDHTIALWARTPDSGLAAAIADRPQVTLFYSDLIERGVLYTLYGNASVCTDAEISNRVWNASPDVEKAQDPDRKGVAVIIDLVRVVAQSRRPELNFVMVR